MSHFKLFLSCTLMYSCSQSPLTWTVIFAKIDQPKVYCHMLKSGHELAILNNHVYDFHCPFHFYVNYMKLGDCECVWKLLTWLTQIYVTNNIVISDPCIMVCWSAQNIKSPSTCLRRLASVLILIVPNFRPTLVQLLIFVCPLIIYHLNLDELFMIYCRHHLLQHSHITVFL